MGSIRKVLWITLGLNVAVAMAKLLVGLSQGALALVGDGIHSFSDASSNVIGLIGMYWAAKPADDDHHYGHHKVEIMAATAIAVFLFITAWEICKRAVLNMGQPVTANVDALAFAVSIGTFGVNVFVATYERRAARRLGSRFLEADAAHTASDLWVTATVMVSLVALELGIPIVDPIFALGIGLYIGYIGWGILSKNATVLMDTAPLAPEDVRREVLAVPGVLSCHKIRTRGWEGHIFIDLHVQIDPSLDTVQGHRIAHSVQEHVKAAIAGVEDVLIHTEPARPEP